VIRKHGCTLAGSDNSRVVVPTSLCQRGPPEYKALLQLDICKDSGVATEVRVTAYAPFHYPSPFLCIRPSHSCPCSRNRRTQSSRSMRFIVSWVGVVRADIHRCGLSCREHRDRRLDTTIRVEPKGSPVRDKADLVSARSR